MIATESLSKSSSLLAGIVEDSIFTGMSRPSSSGTLKQILLFKIIDQSKQIKNIPHETIEDLHQCA